MNDIAPKPEQAVPLTIPSALELLTTLLRIRDDCDALNSEEIREIIDEVIPRLAHPDFPSDLWTTADQAAADGEGWNIYEAHGGMEIERNDINDVEGARDFDSDDTAIEFVQEKAQAGSDMHARALAIHHKYLSIIERNARDAIGA